MSYDTKPTPPPSLVNVAGWLAKNRWAKEAIAVRDAIARIAELERANAELRAERDKLAARLKAMLSAVFVALDNSDPPQLWLWIGDQFDGSAEPIQRIDTLIQPLTPGAQPSGGTNTTTD